MVLYDPRKPWIVHSVVPEPTNFSTLGEAIQLGDDFSGSAQFCSLIYLLAGLQMLLQKFLPELEILELFSWNLILSNTVSCGVVKVNSMG